MPFAPTMSRSTVPSKRPAEAQEAAWVADEDRFVLQQAKKKAAIRVTGGRAEPIDWLAVTLVVIDPERNPLDDEVDETDLAVVDPEAVFDGLDDKQLVDLEAGIDTYMTLEKSRSNYDYWMVSLPCITSCASTDADRLLDDEDHMQRSTKHISECTDIRTRCWHGRSRSGQTLGTQKLGGAGEIGEANSGQALVQ